MFRFNVLIVNKLRWVFAVAFLMVAPSCSTYRDCSYCPDLTRTVISWACLLEQKEFHYLKLESSAAHFDDYLTGLCVRFSSTDLIDLCEARKLIVAVAEGFVDGINYNPNLMDSLYDGYFSPDQLDIVITFESLFGQYVDERYINQIRLQGGCVTYFAFNSFDSKAYMFHRHKESYVDAVIVNDAYQSCRIPEELNYVPLGYDRDRNGDYSPGQEMGGTLFSVETNTAGPSIPPERRPHLQLPQRRPQPPPSLPGSSQPRSPSGSGPSSGSGSSHPYSMGANWPSGALESAPNYYQAPASSLTAMEESQRDPDEDQVGV